MVIIFLILIISVGIWFGYVPERYRTGPAKLSQKELQSIMDCIRLGLTFLGKSEITSKDLNVWQEYVCSVLQVCTGRYHSTYYYTTYLHLCSINVTKIPPYEQVVHDLNYLVAIIKFNRRWQW